MTAKREIIATDKAPQPIGPYNQAVKAHGTLYVSGQIGLDREGNLQNADIKDEARQMMENVWAILIEAGMEFDNVVKCTIYLADMDNFQTVNEIYGEYFGEQAPAREAIEISRLPKGAKVEISLIAME